MVRLAPLCVLGTLAVSEAHKTFAFMDYITGRPPAKDFGKRAQARKDAAAAAAEYEYEYYTTDDENAVRTRLYFRT